MINKILNKKDKTIYNTFLSGSYQRHNVARLMHLDSLGLDLKNKSVLEFGAGIGDHTYYYLIKGCNVTSTDAREELIETISNRFSNATKVLDVEKDIAKINNLEFHDIIHCYGLLYHISNPDSFLRTLKGKCNLLLLETCVSHDYRKDDAYIVAENKDSPTQAMSGNGCRPTRSWIIDIIREIFPYVYLPIHQPNHEEFPKDWTTEIEDRSKPIRAIFIGSTNRLNSELLTEDLIKIYE